MKTISEIIKSKSNKETEANYKIKKELKICMKNMFEFVKFLLARTKRFS